MANTNDRLKGDLEEMFKDYNVDVEGVGYALSPFKITLRHKKDGHAHVVSTSLTFKEVADKFKKDVDAHKAAEAAE